MLVTRLGSVLHGLMPRFSLLTLMLIMVVVGLGQMVCIRGVPELEYLEVECGNEMRNPCKFRFEMSNQGRYFIEYGRFFYGDEDLWSKGILPTLVSERIRKAARDLFHRDLNINLPTHNDVSSGEDAKFVLYYAGGHMRSIKTYCLRELYMDVLEEPFYEEHPEFKGFSFLDHFQVSEKDKETLRLLSLVLNNAE